MPTSMSPETVDTEAYAPALTQFIAEAEALDVVVVIPAPLANVPIGLRALRFLWHSEMPEDPRSPLRGVRCRPWTRPTTPHMPRT